MELAGISFVTAMGVLASIIAVSAIIPYVITMIQGRTKPHPLTWFIWVFISAIVFMAQIAEGANAGAWVTATSGVAALFIAVYGTWKNGIHMVRKLDWVTFGLALLSIVLWVVTDEPMLASIFVTIANVLGVIPTMRKAWTHPESENALSYSLHMLKWVPGLLVLQPFTIATALYPLVACVINSTLTIIILRGRFPIMKKGG